MLWDAGQRRISREGRERLAELYVGVRDGYVAGNVATGKAKSRGDIRPSYVREAATAPDAAAQRATLGRIARMFPDSVVRRGDS